MKKGDNMKNRLYVIICLKRSEYPTKKIFWRPNMAGYTSDFREAGLYASAELDNCAGRNGDWIVEPVTSYDVKILEVNRK